MIEPTTKHELEPEEIEKLGRHAGELARRIDLMEEQRKEAAKDSKEEIDILKGELANVHEWLRTGIKEVPAQGQMFGQDQRLDECRDVVANARQEIAE